MTRSRENGTRSLMWPRNWRTQSQGAARRRVQDGPTSPPRCDICRERRPCQLGFDYRTDTRCTCICQSELLLAISVSEPISRKIYARLLIPVNEMCFRFPTCVSRKLFRASAKQTRTRWGNTCTRVKQKRAPGRDKCAPGGENVHPVENTCTRFFLVQRNVHPGGNHVRPVRKHVHPVGENVHCALHANFRMRVGTCRACCGTFIENSGVTVPIVLRFVLGCYCALVCCGSGFVDWAPFSNLLKAFCSSVAAPLS